MLQAGDTPVPQPLSGLLTHSFNGEVKGQYRCQCGRGFAQQVDNPHTACTGSGLVGGERWLPSGEVTHMLPSPPTLHCPKP